MRARRSSETLGLLPLLLVAAAAAVELEVQPVDPDVYRNVSQIIANKGYPVEEYNVVTKDGFVLGIQRIPSGKKQAAGEDKQVVFLQHGLLGSSADWVINYPNESLAYILADAGYDVWLGNVRGNTYSRHLKYSRRNKEFWQFSFDQMIEYDLPAMIDHVLAVTKKKQLFYVGHSQGSLILFGLLSEQPEYNQKITLFSAFGPVTTVGFIQSPIRLLAPFAYDGLFLANLFGEYDFLPSNWLIKLLARTMCQFPVTRSICTNILFLLCGPDIKEINLSRLPVFMSHTPAGTSVRNIVHFGQLVESFQFAKFDFGKRTNTKVYGQATPPVYNITNVAAPVALFSSFNDWFADATDVALLSKRLTNMVLDYKVTDPTFTHIDFIVGVRARPLVYDPTIQLMTRYRGDSNYP